MKEFLTSNYSLILSVSLLILSCSCKKKDPEPEHYTVCVTCVLKNTGDTIPDKCMSDELVAGYINRMANAQTWDKKPIPFKCWPH